MSKSAKARNERIKAAILRLGLEGKDLYSLGEIESIMKESKSGMFEVMSVLRYDRCIGHPSMKGVL